jgi:hypothetical protein
MLTHVVCFKFTDPADAAEAARRLAAMEGRIDALQGIEVGVDITRSARSYDVALNHASRRRGRPGRVPGRPAAPGGRSLHQAQGAAGRRGGLRVLTTQPPPSYREAGTTPRLVRHLRAKTTSTHPLTPGSRRVRAPGGTPARHWAYQTGSCVPMGVRNGGLRRVGPTARCAAAAPRRTPTTRGPAPGRP